MGNKTRYTANLVSDNNLFVDITNDRVGIGSTQPTAKLDVDGTLNVAGISTFQGNVNLGDNDKIKLGDNDDFQIFHHSNGTGIIQNAGSGQLQLRSDTIRLLNQATDEDFAFFRDDGAVELYYDHSKKFETTGYGVTVAGIVSATSLNISGVSTFIGTVGVNTIDFSTGTFFKEQNYLVLSAVNDLYIQTPNNGKTITIQANDDVNITSTYGSVLTRAQQGAKLIDSNTMNGHVSLSYVTGPGALGSEERLVTTGVGVIITGICSATSFSGNGNDIVHSTWTLGANGSSHYTFTGPGGLSNTDDPKIYLARGETYEFVNNSGGSHPFQIQQSNGSAYGTGVTNNGASSGTIRFEVPFDAPNTLQYKCTNHSSMGNTIIVYPDISP